jgi:hypothetical protein
MVTTIRFSQFNASLNRNNEGDALRDLSTTTNAQARAVAEIIQRTNPDVLLLNEFDYLTSDPLAAVRQFQQNYLSVSQNGATPVQYRFSYIAPSNTGIATGLDLNNNGVAVTTPGAPGYGDDAFGFGNFPGQFGMVLLSKYEIDTANVRTFQNFKWKDMPGGLLTNDPTPGANNLSTFYSAQERDILRLSSKSHWDVPIIVDGQTYHVLASHPTPPVFDGPEDRNGKRNFDEIRFWSDYVTAGKADYIYDDKNTFGGIAAGSRFVIMGDQNADPIDGDSYNFAVRQLLNNPNINTNFIPTSAGGPQQSTLQGGANVNHGSNPAFDTADFADTTPGNLRADYVLPSANLGIENARVFWPLNTDPNFAPVGVFTPSLPGGYPSSDHRLVWVDVQTAALPQSSTTGTVTFQGQITYPTGFTPTGAAGAIAGTAVPVGGLSSVTYDAANNRYYAISDDRSSNARFYTFTANPATLPTAGVTFTNVTQLRDANNAAFAANSLDPEGIALTRNNTVFISSEGEVSNARVLNPFINEFNLTTGQQVRSLAVPRKFLPVIQDTNGNGLLDAGETQTAGIRNNLAFESLTISPDQRFLFTATENALVQDGTAATTTTTSPARIIQYNLVSGQAEKEYLYEVERVVQAPVPATNFATNGLVDLLAIDDRGTFLALERSFSAGVPGTGNTIKLYEISLQGATDISVFTALNSLSSADRAAIKPVRKRLLLDLNTLNLPTGLDNVEGITFGPRLADGRQSVLLVSDNNFSATQFTQILALSLETAPIVVNSDKTFTIGGGAGTAQLQFNLTQRDAGVVNEVGFFTVDDDKGSVNGIAPGQAGYTQAALARARVVFSALSDRTSSEVNAVRNLAVNSSDRLQFFLVQDGSVDSARSGQGGNVFFGNPTGNSDRFDRLRVERSSTNVFTLRFEDGGSTGDQDFNDLVLTFQLTNNNPTKGTGLQGQSQAELIDLRGLPAATNASFTVSSEAQYNNTIGFYTVNNAQGQVTDPTTGATLSPGDAGYARAAMRLRVATVDRNGSSPINLTGGKLLAPFLIANSTVDNFLAVNPTNQSRVDTVAYFAYLGANPDRQDHIRLLGDNTFGFEDLAGGGDKDFNDIVAQVRLS